MHGVGLGAETGAVTEFAGSALTWNENVPIVRIRPMNAGHSRRGGQTGWNVSMILPRNVPVHHDLPPTGASFALTRASSRGADTLAKAVDTQP